MVDPLLILSICETESHFNPRAVSSVGAIGIMQIMPETGRWIAGVLDYNDYNEECLYDPDVNIRFGAYYLSYLELRFSDRVAVIAAYNAGEGAVREWLSNENFSFDEIPFVETREYVEKVESVYRRYEKKKVFAFN